MDRQSGTLVIDLARISIPPPHIHTRARRPSAPPTTYSDEMECSVQSELSSHSNFFPRAAATNQIANYKIHCGCICFEPLSYQWVRASRVFQFNILTLTYLVS